MKPTIISQRENPLLKRKELQISIHSEGATPKKEDLAGTISTMLSVDKKLVVIGSINQRFGSKESQAFVKVYNSEADLKAIEPPVKEKKEKPKAEEAEAKPAEGEAKPEGEKPAEGETQKEEKPAEVEKKESTEVQPSTPPPPAQEKPKEKQEPPKEEKKEEMKDEQKEQ